MGSAVVCLFGTVAAAQRITEYERDDDRREQGQYKNYLQYTKEAHILVIIKNYIQKWKNKSKHRNPKLLHQYNENE
jgi:hypothetical protein